MPFEIVRNDITKMRADAIVNAANTALQMGGGVCGAIFSAAGAEKLQAACNLLAPIKTGEAVITPGFDLPAKHVIHAAGPIYHDGKQGEEELLRLCYANALDIAQKNGCESIAFPLISSGIYGYPKDEALSVATSAIGKWLLENDMDVSLVIFDKAAFELSRELQSEVKAFIDKNYAGSRDDAPRPKMLLAELERDTRQMAEAAQNVDMSQMPPAAKLRIGSVFARKRSTSRPAIDGRAVAKESRRSRAVESWLGRLDEPFSITLFRLIKAKGKTDVEVYKRANIDRRLFSKIRAERDYRPKKETVIALAIALELTLAETADLLKRAGLALSRSMLFDVIVEYFIMRGKYDIFEINNVLYKYDQPILGGHARD